MDHFPVKLNVRGKPHAFLSAEHRDTAGHLLFQASHSSMPAEVKQVMHRQLPHHLDLSQRQVDAVVQGRPSIDSVIIYPFSAAMLVLVQRAVPRGTYDSDSLRNC